MKGFIQLTDLVGAPFCLRAERVHIIYGEGSLQKRVIIQYVDPDNSLTSYSTNLPYKEVIKRMTAALRDS